MGINSIDQLLVPAYTHRDFDPSSVSPEVHKDVEDYKRVNAIVLELERAGNTTGIVDWETVMNIFEMSQGQYGMVETADDLKQILHMGFGTEVDEVKGIGTSSDGMNKENIYLGYSKHFPVVSEESSVTAELWHFIPRYNYPAVELRVIPNGTTVGVWVRQGANGEEKNRLANYYKTKEVEDSDSFPPNTFEENFSDEGPAVVQDHFADYQGDDPYTLKPGFHESNEIPTEEPVQLSAYNSVVRDIGAKVVAVAFQEEQIIQLESESEEPEGPHEKPTTIQQKARALLDKVISLSDPQRDENGIYLSMPRHIMEVDDVMDALCLTSQEINVSKKNPFMLLQGLMDSSFSNGDICVERIELKKRIGDHMQHVVWRIRNNFDDRETIDVTLVSPSRGGKWTAGSLTVRRNEIQRNFRKSLPKKPALKPQWKNTKNTESQTGYTQASFFSEP